jgi:hypothetical protein
VAVIDRQEGRGLPPPAIYVLGPVWTAIAVLLLYGAIGRRPVVLVVAGGLSVFAVAAAFLLHAGRKRLIQQRQGIRCG